MLLNNKLLPSLLSLPLLHKEAISRTVSGWHVWILLCILTVQKLWDFNFLQGLPPDLLDEFLMESYKRSVNPLTFLRVMRFSRENCSSAGTLLKKGFLACSSIIRSSKRRTQNPSKSVKKTRLEAKGCWYTTGKVIQRLSNIDLYTYLAIYHYRWSKQ